MDYTRFCMSNCLPTVNATGEVCTHGSNDDRDLALKHSDIAVEVAQNSGAVPNSHEPVQLSALTLAHNEEAPEAADQAGLEEALAAASVTPDPSTVDAEDRDTGAMVAQAQGNRALAAGLDARIATAEANSARTLSNSSHVLRGTKNAAQLVSESKAEIQARSVQVAIYARSAERAAEKAKEELQEIKDAPKVAAEEAAEVAIEEFHRRTAYSKLVSQAAALTVNPPGAVVPVNGDAQRAAAPYYASMGRSFQTQALYETKARALQDHAEVLQNQVRTFSQQAVAYQNGGKESLAKDLLGKAKSALSQANAANTEAQQWFAMAEHINQGLPQFQAAAAQAAAHAPPLAAQFWLPPPPVGPPPPAAGAPAAAAA